MEDRIHLAAAPPAFCAACYQAKPDSRHVDFEAAYDGPTFASTPGEVAGGKVITVDDLVICEDCLRIAAILLGLGDAEQLRKEIEQLTGQFEQASDRLAAQAAHIESLEHAGATREQLEQKMAPKTASRRKPKARA